jgi:hypothetical protein
MPVVERVWEWHFAASPEALWPLVADTARIGEAAGFPRYTVTDIPQPDGSVERIGSARRFGMTMTWEEGVPEWIAGRRYSHERRFRSRLFRRLASRIELDPEPGGTRVRYRTTIEAPGRWRWRCAAAGCGAWEKLDRLFREAARFAEANLPQDFAARSAVAPAVRSRVAAQARRSPSAATRRRPARRSSARRARDRARAHAAARAGAALAGGAARGDRDLPRGGARRAADPALGPRLPAMPRRQGHRDEPRPAAAGRALPVVQHRLRARFRAQRRGHLRAGRGGARARRRQLLPGEPAARRARQDPATPRARRAGGDRGRCCPTATIGCARSSPAAARFHRRRRHGAGDRADRRRPVLGEPARRPDRRRATPARRRARWSSRTGAGRRMR